MKYQATLDSAKNLHTRRGNTPQRKPLSLMELIGTTLAAALGVQSSKNKVRDFERGKPIQFILSGAIFTLIFVAILVGIVKSLV